MLVVEEVHHARRPVTHGDEVRGRPVQTQQAQGGTLLHAVHGVSERRAAVRQAWPRAHGQPPGGRSPRTTPQSPRGMEPTDNTPEPPDNTLGPPGDGAHRQPPRGRSPRTIPRGPQGTESTDNTLRPPGDRGAPVRRVEEHTGKGCFGFSTQSSSGLLQSVGTERRQSEALSSKDRGPYGPPDDKACNPNPPPPTAVTETGG